MIFITGDCHGEFHKFNTERFPEQKGLTKDDYVIICGDFGGIWCGETDYVQKKTEDYWIRWLNEKPFTTLFVDGNHENHRRLNEMEAVPWHGGHVHQVADSVFHLMRGEVFEIGDRRVFAFGGASSHDISDGIIDGNAPDWRRQAYLMELAGKYMYRIRGISWWEEELPSEAEMERGLENLARVGNKVDLIVTHCAPTSIQTCVSDEFQEDRLTAYLDRIRAEISYRYWFFGHYHDDLAVTRKDFLLYDLIHELPQKKPRKN